MFSRFFFSFNYYFFYLRYLNSQRESTTLRDLNEKLEQELKNKEEQSILTQEKVKAISEKLDISEQKLIEFASMPDIEEQLRDRMEALTQVRHASFLSTPGSFSRVCHK